MIWILIGAGVLAISFAVAVIIGKGIKLADMIEQDQK